MKAHPSKTDIYWQSIHEKHNQNPISQAEYEEWRANPVTLRMFDDFEYSLLIAQKEATEAPSDSSYSPIVHAALNALGEAVMKMFEWSPEEIELEEE